MLPWDQNLQHYPLIVETGDFERFAKENQCAAYLGLAPGEDSSFDSIHRLGIKKAGNGRLRQLVIKAAGGICKGAVGHKSRDLRARQNGNRQMRLRMQTKRIRG